MISTTSTTQNHATQPIVPDRQQLLARLEAGYEYHTEQLTRLAAIPDTDPERALTRDSLAAASRQALTLIAGALRNMAEGRYGICVDCQKPVPAERLEVHPEARYGSARSAAPDVLPAGMASTGTSNSRHPTTTREAELCLSGRPRGRHWTGGREPGPAAQPLQGPRLWAPTAPPEPGIADEGRAL